uniref:EF-hand domain-containing protein n=1 Tax=Panagrolaimus superbus TaxID=310955 RepID=A0A914Z2W1_9BILA
MSREEILEVFLYYDKKGDGKIDVGLVGSCLRSLGLSPTEEDVSTFTKQWKEKDARITVEEFLPIFKAVQSHPTPTADDFMELLANFDREGNGMIQITDLRYVLVNSGEKLTEEEADILLQGQESGDGKVNIAEFVRHITAA